MLYLKIACQEVISLSLIYQQSAGNAMLQLISIDQNALLS